MRSKLIATTILTAGIITACVSKKPKQSETIAEPAIQLDTIKVTGVKGDNTSEVKKLPLYRAANPRSNDILHTKLEVRFDWQNAWLFGKATIDIKPYYFPVSKLFLNARGMEIYKVQLVSPKGNLDLKYKYENDSIKIDLDKEYTRNDKYTVFIDYKSKPNDLKAGGSRAISSDKGLYFINPKGEDPDKMPQIWTQGETQGNSVWFPTIDSPNEKMTNEIQITVDNKYTTLSNGILTNQIKNADGTRTDVWKMDLPHSPYLIMMGIGEFKKVVDQPWNGKEISYYVEKQYEPYAKAIFGNTKEMIEFYSNRLGVPYAWQKYAQIVARDYVSGAMENTTATLHGDFVYKTDRELLDGSRGEDVIAHELFHQWFGDLVTCESWSNLPLNESFATYGEYLWEEYKYGRDAADAHHYNSRLGYLAESANKQVDLVRFDYEAREDMFDGHSYNKGGQVLHMLRRYVGDDAFFASLKLYLEKFKFKNAEVHDLRLCFEEVTGEDLNWFFNQWFYSSGHPELDIKYSYDEAKGKVSVTIKQEQDLSNTPLFRIPVEIDIYTEPAPNERSRPITHKIVITQSPQTFTFDVPRKPILINFDPGKYLLCKRTENKTLDNYIIEYSLSPYYLDRLEALQGLKGHLNKESVYNAVKEALKDPYYEERRLAIAELQDVATEKEKDLKPLMIELARKDPKTSVRSDAINFLAKNYQGDDVIQIFKEALNDRSYLVIGSGLQALAKVDPKAAMAKARDLEKEESNEIRYSIMDLYATHGDDSHYDFFVSQKSKFSGFEVLGYLNLFSSFLQRCTDEHVVKGAELMKTYTGKTGNIYVKYFAQKVLKDLHTRYQDKADELEMKIAEAKKNSKDTTELESQLRKCNETKVKIKEINDSAH